MSIKELVDRVRSQIDEATLAKVGAVLEEIRAEGSTIADSLSAANNESKSRKIKIRELEGLLEDRDVEIDGYKKKIETFDTKPIEQERDKYKSKYKVFLDSQRSNFISFYDKVKSNESWARVKDEYKFPEEKDGKPDWDNLTDDDLENNVTKMSYHQKLGLFESQHKPDPSLGKRMIDGKQALTPAEYMEIRTKYGPSSPEAKEAYKQVRK